MPVQRSYGVLVVSISLAVCLVVILQFFSHLGGLLNRSRGGYVDFRKAAENSSSVDSSLGLDYWPAEICKNLLFAVPTAVVVLLFGLHLRASVAVLILTWCSLYIGWGSYMNIGDVPTNYGSRSGVYDWLLGRQEDENWSYDRRLIREFSGMSLRGLAWTAPQGYLLQLLGFGWEYSLSGSLMGFVYYLGSRTPVDSHSSHFSRMFGAHTAYAEYYWGIWVWFVLIVCCLSQVVRRVHVWIYSKKEYLGFRPFSTWEKVKYESLNRSLSHALYEGFMLAFNLLLMCSLVFYSLVVQEDIRNKGMTFFGLFIDIILLTFLQGWSYNLIYLKLRRRWLSRRRAGQVSLNSSGGAIASSFQSPRASPRIPDLDNLETAAAIANGENKPLLGWNNAQSTNLYQASPSLERHHGTLMGNDSPTEQYRPHLQLGTVEPATTTTAILILWPTIEKWVWVDVFIWLRRLIGLVSMVATVVTIVTCTAALFWNYETRRYLHPNCTYQYNGV